MAEHPALPRLAEIYVSDAAGVDRRGTGYLVGPGWVLTAAHVVHGARSIELWLGSPRDPRPEDGIRVDPPSVLVASGAEPGRPDLALLPVPIGVGNVEPVLFGRLDRAVVQRVPAVAAGFPRFRLRPAGGASSERLRELTYATGGIVPGAGAKKGQFALGVDDAPGADPDPRHSPWEGMSGAAVWAGARLIGVVAEHHPGDGLTALTVEPLEQFFLGRDDPSQEAWRRALPQLPDRADGLWLAMVPSPAQQADRRAQVAARELSPPVLLARERELAVLARLATPPDRWSWLTAGAFAGKTSMLAWFVLHPPDGLDVVSCFLQRARTANTPGYALDVLNRQLASLTGVPYDPPDHPADGAAELRWLLSTAAMASGQRGRRLLLLVDGLDEYDPSPFVLNAWFPQPPLPDGVSVLVSSRTGAPVDLDPGHPLYAAVWPIEQSGAARDIQQRAAREIQSALADPMGIEHPIVGLLSVAGYGLTAVELAELVQLTGRPTDAAAVTRTMQTSLASSVRATERRRGERVEVRHVFAHESLLAAAEAVFADARPQYRGYLDAWVDGYVARRWPSTTPRYLFVPWLRHLIARTTERGEEGAAARERVRGLCGDPGWLNRAVRGWDVDRTLEALAEAHGAVTDDWLDALTRALRRSRVALANDPDELASQLCARLAGESDRRLQELVRDLTDIAPRPWLRVRGRALGWRTDLETTFAYSGEVRAVAFGQVGSHAVLAVGAGNLVEIRDLQRGGGAEWICVNGPGRVTAVAMGELESRAVAVAVARYDGLISIHDVRSGQSMKTFPGVAEAVAVGWFGGRAAVAGVEHGQLLAWDVKQAARAEPAAMFADRSIVGVGTVEGRLVAHAVDPESDGSWRVLTLDLERGDEVAPAVELSSQPDLVASWSYQDGVAIVAREADWRVTGYATPAGPLRPTRGTTSTERARALAIARVGDRFIATIAPDNDLELGFVTITELAAGDAEKLSPADDVEAAPVLPDRIEAVLAGGDGEGQLLTDAPVTLVDLASGAVVDPRPSADLVSMALTGQPSGDFVESGEGGGLRLRVAPSASEPEQRFGRRLVLPAQEPDRWPTVTRAYGRVGRVPVVARGSYDGAVWITDLTTGQTTHGPFTSLPEESTIFFGVKPSPRVVESVAVGEVGSAARVAAAFEGHAWIADLVSEPELRVLDTPSVVAVALGAVGGQSVAVTGSISGLVGIWRADTGERIAGLTLDAGVNRVWVVHGTDAVAARTIDGAIVIADLVS